MSSHVKVRKSFPLIAGAIVEVTIQAHMIPESDATDMVERIFSAAALVVSDKADLLKNRDRAIAAKASEKLQESQAKVYAAVPEVTEPSTVEILPDTAGMMVPERLAPEERFAKSVEVAKAKHAKAKGAK